MSNFLIFKAPFNNSVTPAIGTYTAEGATARFNRNTSKSPNYYLYNTANNAAVQWFVPTAETADFEFVADILTTYSRNWVSYFRIADSTGAIRLHMWSQYADWYFENGYGTSYTSDPQYMGSIGSSASGGNEVFHNFRVRVRKLTESSSSVEIYVDGTLKLTRTARVALITCAKIGFVGGVPGPGIDAGIKNAYVYDLSGGDVIDCGVLSGAFNRFISLIKSKFALKSDIPTVNNATLTIQQNGTNVQTFTANQSTNVTANISVPTKTSDLTNDSGFLTSADLLPVGSYIQFAGSQAPDGFLVCNGSAISRTTYSALFAVIGTKYGSGDGSTTFNLPNLINRFLQGSTTSGTVKNAGLPNITGNNHALYWKGTQEDNKVSGAFYSTQDLIDEPVGSGANKFGQCDVKFDASRSSFIYGNSSTVQPPALTCLICIKY